MKIKEIYKNNRLQIKKILVGIFAGVISGMFAAGGGMIVVPALIHLFNLEDSKARATSVFAILPMVITSGIFYYNNNYIDWKIGILCAIGGIIRRIYRSKTFKKGIFKSFKNNICNIFNICIYKDDYIKERKTYVKNFNRINFWNS